jgi:hypothetical protein
MWTSENLLHCTVDDEGMLILSPFHRTLLALEPYTDIQHTDWVAERAIEQERHEGLVRELARLRIAVRELDAEGDIRVPAMTAICVEMMATLNGSRRRLEALTLLAAGCLDDPVVSRLVTEGWPVADAVCAARLVQTND